MDIQDRAERFAALGDRARLEIIDDLAVSDRSPAELASRHGLTSNLLAHHLDVLEQAGLIARSRSSGDGRRRYVHLLRDSLDELRIGVSVPAGPVLFLCTHNSARSQLASAIWNSSSDTFAASAGTQPAAEVHPGAVAAAARAGYDLSGAIPQRLSDVQIEPSLVITVCDRAHEELDAGSDWLHWSIPDPVEQPTTEAFDVVVNEIEGRIAALQGGKQRD